MSALTVRSLVRSFGADRPVVDDVSFDVADGRIVALIGPSGCGKSTLLRLIAGLERPDAGDVSLDGVSVVAEPPERRGIGLMFQDLALFPHLSVADNVAFGLRMAGWKRDRRRERVQEMLSLVGLRHLADRAIDQLSGGERQRIALARTLAPAPAVVLLDEPLGALDEQHKQSLRADLRTLLRAVGSTAIVVSHDLPDAIAVADDLMVMRDGVLLQAGELPAVLGHPATAQVAAMLGYVALLDGEVQQGMAIEVGVGMIDATAAGSLPPGGPVRVMAHPTALLAVPIGQGMGIGVRGPVIDAAPEGPQFRVRVRLGEREVSVRWEWDISPPPPGTSVEVVARPGTLRAYSGLPPAAPAAPDAAAPDADVPPDEDADAPAVGAPASPLVDSRAAGPAAGSDAPPPREADDAD